MVALITGASSGIGFDMALYLSELGYDIIAVGRNKKKLNLLQKKCRTKVIAFDLDLSLESNIYKLHDCIEMYNIDILINAAGFGVFGAFGENHLDKELEMIDVNIKALHILTKLILKDMIIKDKGYILNVSSLASFMPGPLMSSYYASKAYVTRLTEAINYELKKNKSNVHISILCPGPVDTNFNETAGVNFSIKPMTSSDVAIYGIDKMFKEKLIIVPGFINKITRIISKIIPNNILMIFSYKIQSKKAK